MAVSAASGRMRRHIYIGEIRFDPSMTSDSDVDILVTPSPEANRHDLFIMAAEVEEALGSPVDFLIRSDVEAMKNGEARDLILKSAVTVYVPSGSPPWT